MRPVPGQPPVDLSPLEQAVARRVRRAKLFVFLRTHRHTLFDAAFQDELSTLYQEVVRAGGLTLANVPEATVTDAIAADVTAQGATLGELHIDRADLGSALVRDRAPEVTLYCKAWPVRHGAHVAKTAFHLAWERTILTCPQGVEMSFVPGGLVHFPAATCQVCPVRDRCTASPHGRSVSIHRDERLLQALRERQSDADRPRGVACARAG